MFSERLRELRENHKMPNGENMTQDDLAKILGYSGKSTVSQWESGVRKPDYDTLKKLSQIFDCTTDYLLGKTNKRQYTIEAEDPSVQKLMESVEGYLRADPTMTDEEKETIVEDTANFFKFLVDKRKGKQAE